MNAVTEDEILAECGLDSLCILRLLGVGYKIALLSIFNAVWLMPLYATATPDATITDPFVTVTIANVASGSTRLIGTVIAAYILFGYVMYLILREFEWFTEKRHKHLQTPVAENYTVYVRNIDPEYRSNAAMADYFAHCFTAKSVLEAKLRIRAPTLSAAVAKRDKLVEKLEHALNYERVKQETPMHRPQHLRRRVPSIPLYASELRSANQDVVAWMDTIQRKTLRKESERPLDGVDGGGGIDYLHITEIIRGQWKSNSSSSSKSSLVVLQDIDDTSELYVDALEQSASLTENDDFAMLDEGNNGNDSNSNNEPQQRLSTRDVLNQGVNLLTTKTLSVAKSAAQLIPSTVEGDFYSAGFVTFSSLGFTQAALQMVHHAKPFDIEVSEAPRPNDIFWTNVGRSHKDLQIGRLVSFAATAALCLLWTIPMTFIASLSSVQALSQKFAFIGDLIQKFPFIGKVLEILAPLFVRLVNSLLPTILRYLTLFEGPVSESVVSASLFTKLAAFMIIQTFFVSAVSSSLLQGTQVDKNRCDLHCSVKHLTLQPFTPQS